MRFLLIITILLTLPNMTFAQVLNQHAKDVLARGATAEEKGLEIVKEADSRDLGFGDSTVDIEMVLKNSHGDSNTRKMRNKTFEIQDLSVGDKTMIIFDRPRDLKGTAFLTFSKILDPDDQWLYLPSLKRVKRISSKNKSGPFMGSELAYEDISSQEVEKYSYKYLKNESCPNDAGLTCFMLERYPLYEHSGYTKMVTWIDAESYRLQKVDFYDRKGSLLKSLTYSDYKQYLGKFWRAGTFSVINHQTGKSTDLFWKNYKFRTGLKESDLTKEVLKRAK